MKIMNKYNIYSEETKFYDEREIEAESEGDAIEIYLQMLGSGKIKKSRIEKIVNSTQMENTKKVAIYSRSATTPKQGQDINIENQLTELRKICKDFEIIKEYVDAGCNGNNLNRSGLDNLRADAKSGLFNRLYIFSADRLSRNSHHQAMIIKELTDAGVEIFIKDKSIKEIPFNGIVHLMNNIFISKKNEK